MDVSLILTHRCNLDCHYCYAGEHHRTDMDDLVLGRAIELLFSDGSARAQLSFFGGEPFIAFERMKRAVELAEAKAAELQKEVVFQCTSNGTRIGDEELRFIREHRIHVTVSIDGIREAHEANRPLAGGRSSFEPVLAGLRRLIAAGVSCDALMVITPRTAEHVYLSASSLWSEGVTTVRANVALEQTWSKLDRAELREQLVSVGWELLARRLKGEAVRFKPFDKGMRATTSAAPGFAPKKPRLVVATSGHLYPCAPMVGEDRDDGEEATLRIGHLDDGEAAILGSVTREGVACDRGGACECAAYLETGDRKTPGAMGQWYGMVCREVGETVARSLAQSPPPKKKKGSRRRPILMGLAAIVGGAAIGAPLLSGLLAEDPEVTPLRPRPCRLPDDSEIGVAGEMPVEPMVPGQMEAPVADPPPDPPKPEEEYMIDGEMEMEPEPIELEVLGDFDE